MSQGKAENQQLRNNFGGLPAKYSGYRNANIVILPVPFDRTSSWIRGSSRGPRAIIDASANMELYDIETASEVYRKGIHTAKKIDSRTSRGMISAVEKKAGTFLDDNKFSVVLGGEHTVSLGAIKAHAGRISNLSILHLDAHSDMRDSYEGDTYSHACVMARAKEITDNIVSVGIRSMDVSERKNIDEKNVFYASGIRTSRDWIKKAARRLSNNVYITIDLDVFDTSIMPSTGTPEPGGLGWYDVIDLMERVIHSKNVVGCDVVELCPIKGHTAPDFLAAKLIYKILSLKFVNPLLSPTSSHT